jgi:hypothetical protein
VIGEHDMPARADSVQRQEPQHAFSGTDFQNGFSGELACPIEHSVIHGSKPRLSPAAGLLVGGIPASLEPRQPAVAGI